MYCRYTHQPVAYGLEANRANPEIDMSSVSPHKLVEKQMSDLERAAQHLNNAKLGIDVDWLDLDGNDTELSVCASVPCYVISVVCKSQYTAQ